MSTAAVNAWWAVEWAVIGVTIGASGLLGVCLRRRKSRRPALPVDQGVKLDA